jgi:hypothetical protein
MHSGWSYTVGSILFVIEGVFAWGSQAFPEHIHVANNKYADSLLFFIGTLFYQIGATMAYLEAINDGSFAGSAMRRFLDTADEEDQKRLLDEKLGRFFGRIASPFRITPAARRKRKSMEAEKLKDEKRQQELDPEAGWRAMDRRDRPGSIYPGAMRPSGRRGGRDLGGQDHDIEYLTWRWWPTWHRFITYHIREVGYVSCTIQLFGATLYGVTGVVNLPGVFDQLKEPWQENWAFWIPQIVASVCFLTAGFGFTYETQKRWYKPELGLLGWWIGAWAVVGSAGFL